MPDSQNPLFAAIEAGGTKFVCAVGNGPGEKILARQSFPTGDDPAVLFSSLVGWFRQQEEIYGRFAAFGIASFGPVDLQPGSASWGHITSTPKPGWENTDVVGAFRAVWPDLPVGWDTDVNGAALGEHRWGAGQGLTDFVYITVGTGIGGGGMADSRIIHGLIHPEMGHMKLPRKQGDHFSGSCPYHGDCWEGLCSGPAILSRTGSAATELEAGDPAWDLTCQYMGAGLANLAMVLSPQRIILGGSVPKGGRMGQQVFFEKVCHAFREQTAGYIRHPLVMEQTEQFIVPPALGDNAGICGAIALAHDALKRGSR